MVARCASCLKGACGLCVVRRPQGEFCSDSCANRYEHYYKDKPVTRRRGSVLVKLVQVVLFVGVGLGALHWLGNVKGFRVAKIALEFLGLGSLGD